MKTYDTLSTDLQALISKPKNEKDLKNISLIITGNVETSRGICWTADLKIDGKTVATVENEGNGGCNRYSPKNKSLYSELVETAKLAYPKNPEPLDTLVAYLDVMSSFEGL